MTDDLPDIAQQIAHFESRLRLDPQSRVFLPLADLYRRSGELEHARDLLERGLGTHPRFVAARAALGLVQVQLGQTDAARASLDQVLAVDPDNVLALEVLHVNQGVQTTIRSGKTEAIESAIQTGKRDGMIMFDDDLQRLVREGRITGDTARRFAKEPDAIKGGTAGWT